MHLKFGKQPSVEGRKGMKMEARNEKKIGGGDLCSSRMFNQFESNSDRYSNAPLEELHHRWRE